MTTTTTRRRTTTTTRTITTRTTTTTAQQHDSCRRTTGAPRIVEPARATRPTATHQGTQPGSQAKVEKHSWQQQQQPQQQQQLLLLLLRIIIIMEFSGDGGWRAGMLGEGGGSDYFFFLGGGGGARNIIILCVFQFIPTSSEKKIEAQFIRMSSNSFVCLPPKRSLNPNSFVCLQIHSYIFQKKHCISIPSSVFQFIRMSSNSFVCLLGGDGGWRAGMVGGGGGSDYIYLFFLGGEGGRGTLLFCVYSNAFVCLPIHSYVFGKKLKPNSFVCLPIHSYVYYSDYYY